MNADTLPHIHQAEEQPIAPAAADVATPSRHTAEPPALLIDARELARLLAVSLRHVHRMLAAGELPDPVRLGRALRWRRVDIEAFVDAGCDMTRWQAARKRSGR
jgi:excisionase family DNA binding protein